MDKKTAEANLEKAIQDYVQVVVGEDTDPGLLIDWLVITAHHIEEGDGVTATANGIYGPKNQRLYAAAGLVKYADIKINQFYNK